jgi:hypothetical protein
VKGSQQSENNLFKPTTTATPCAPTMTDDTKAEARLCDIDPPSHKRQILALYHETSAEKNKCGDSGQK